MTKKNTTAPKITHTEILCLAIENLENKIADYSQKASKFPMYSTEASLFYDMALPLKEKQDIIKQLYKIETGVEYN